MHRRRFMYGFFISKCVPQVRRHHEEFAEQIPVIDFDAPAPRNLGTTQ